MIKEAKETVIVYKDHLMIQFSNKSCEANDLLNQSLNYHKLKADWLTKLYDNSLTITSLKLEILKLKDATNLKKLPLEKKEVEYYMKQKE